MGTKAAWTPERRARQAEIARQTKPWLNSTGARTAAGKARSSQNARMADIWHELRQRIKDHRSAALELFGRQRMPRWPK